MLLAMIVGLLAGFISLLFLGVEPAEATVRSGFEDRLVTSVDRPMGLAFTPDGRMLIPTKPGQVRVYKDGQLLQTPALNIARKVCQTREAGLLGIALDPGFGTAGRNHVYLFYTFAKFGSCPTDWNPANANNPVNRVSRFVMSGDTIDPSSEEVLIDNIPSPTGNHNSGDLSFGKDGNLYATVGDGECDYASNSGCQSLNDASRDRHVLLGKVLRVTRDGGIPAANPYQGTDSARCGVPAANGRTDPGKDCQETFALGLRNPFRFAFDPDASGTRFFIGDVGAGAWDEIDQGEAGADYAWNLCEGNHDNPARAGSVNCSAAPYTPPIHEYSHTTGCSAVTGGAFVPDGAWPAEYDDSYLFNDYVCNKIFELKPRSGGGFAQTEFASGLGAGGPIDMDFGPYQGGQTLYYVTRANGGEVHRISPTGTANRPPSASLTASPTSGSVPLAVDFDGSGSSDPDAGDTLSYLWSFGDGSGTQTTTTPTTSHTYSTKGTYTASLRVQDNHGALSDPATVRIDAANEAPAPSIGSPSADLLFGVGQQITLSGSATDPEDGQLPASSLEWEVLRHHNGDHTHPYFSGTGNDLVFTAPPPEGISATGAGNFLEIQLTATDLDGLSKTVTREVQPNRMDLSFATSPSGLSLQADDLTFVTPKTLTSWEGYGLSVNAPSPQTLSGTTYVFNAWSDGEGQQHEVLTGATPSTYTATFTATSRACTQTGTSAGETLTGTPGDDVICAGAGNDTIKGLEGNDTLKGEGGADKLYGGVGDDTLDGGKGADTADYSGSATAVSASLATDSATGEGSDTFLGVENLVGSRMDDALIGSGANNTLNGGSGADTLSGQDGADKLTGAGGNDTLHGDLGNDTVVGSGGADQHFGDDGDDAVNSKDGVSGNDSLDGGPGTDAKTTDATEKSITGFP
jgi:glucose/arabinose dehydrogenase/PKD repeat protein